MESKDPNKEENNRGIPGPVPHEEQCVEFSSLYQQKWSEKVKKTKN